MRITPAGGRLGGRRGGHGQLAKLREPECEPVRHGGPARLTKPGGLSLPGDCHHDDDSGLPGNQPGPLNQAVRIYSVTYWQAGTQAGPAGPFTVSGPGRARCASGKVAVTRRGTAARRRHGS